MDHHQHIWDFSTTTAEWNNPSRNGPFISNVSSYFRRPSKVVKSNSRTNSPRNNGGRRRMTTSGHFPTTRTRSVVDYQRASMPQLPHYQAASNRPISWHPNTMEELAYLHVPSHSVVNSTMASPYTIAENNGLVTPMSFPVMDEPQIQELITPLEELLANDSTHTFDNPSQDFSMEAWLSQQQTKNHSQMHANAYPDMGFPSWYNSDQYGTLNTIMPSSSPNNPLMPDFDAPFDDGQEHATNVERDELVGMGLYDSPADVQSSSVLFGTGLGSYTRKSLKLEDAFEPAPASDDDAEEGNSQGGDDDEDAPAEPDDEVPTSMATVHVSTTFDSGNHSTPTRNPTYLGMSHNDFATMRQWNLVPYNTQGAWI